MGKGRGMKAQLLLYCFAFWLTQTAGKPTAPNKCTHALNICFDQCAQKKLNRHLSCTQKKECLNRCNTELITSMRPEICYEKCNKIPCQSIAQCTLNCFKKTPEGICQHQCAQAVTPCLQGCPTPEQNEPFSCLECYAQNKNCKKRCCS